MSNKELGATETIVITPEEANTRLDRILSQRYLDVHSRTYFQNLIRANNVTVNGEAIKKHYRPQEGDEIEITFVLTDEIDLTPEDIPLDILIEDDHIIAINKPAGMVVHPAPGNWTGTFVNALLFHCRGLQSSPSLRPGIVHRLDKDTSGVLIAAKTTLAHQRLIEMFSGREVEKEYLAICLGSPGEGTIETLIGRHPVHRKKMAVREEGGRRAVTHYKTLFYDDKLSLVNIDLETGRTHQIRVHMQYHKTPILGDSTYGNDQTNQRFGARRQLLHAHSLKLRHPITGELLEITAEVPEDMATFISRLDKRKSI